MLALAHFAVTVEIECHNVFSTFAFLIPIVVAGQGQAVVVEVESGSPSHRTASPCPILNVFNGVGNPSPRRHCAENHHRAEYRLCCAAHSRRIRAAYKSPLTRHSVFESDSSSDLPSSPSGLSPCRRVKSTATAQFFVPSRSISMPSHNGELASMSSAVHEIGLCSVGETVDGFDKQRSE